MSILAAGSDWIASTWTAIKNQQESGGIMGALQNSGKGSSLSSVMSRTASTANAFALISQSSVSNASSLLTQIIAQRQEAEANKLFDKLTAELQAQHDTVKPKNVLDSYIYFDNGSMLDTNSNVLTLSDGKQIDAITGAEVIDPASIIQMANGAYLNTSTNILTMPDGTKIDMVTGLTV
jgi:hypothetical protein